MTSSDVESRLAGLLHERAEGAMNETNTQQKLSDLLEEGHRDQQRRQRRWVAGGALVAAAAVMTTVWLANRDTTATEPQPADPAPDAVVVATGFLEDLYADDVSGVEAVLVNGALLEGSGDPNSWKAGAAWMQAAGFSLDTHVCAVKDTSGTETHVLCTYAINAFGSDQLGRGPFPRNTFDLTIENGLITHAVETWAYGTNGFSGDAWEPFAAWLLDKHPSDVARMYSPDQSTARIDAESRRLWERRIAEYVADVKG